MTEMQTPEANRFFTAYEGRETPYSRYGENQKPRPPLEYVGLGDAEVLHTQAQRQLGSEALNAAEISTAPYL